MNNKRADRDWPEMVYADIVGVKSYWSGDKVNPTYVKLGTIWAQKYNKGLSTYY